MGKIAKVPQLDKPGAFVVVEHGATKGAQLGRDLYGSDGTLLTLAQLQALAAGAVVPPPSMGGQVPWRSLIDIPENVQEVVDLATNGLVVRKADGTWTTREILPTVGRTTVANTDGDAGDVVVDLAVVVDSGAGALLAITRDGFGRVSGTKPVTAGDGITIADVGASVEIASSVSGGILPVVTGEVPPVLVYLEDGSLVYAEV